MLKSAGEFVYPVVPCILAVPERESQRVLVRRVHPDGTETVGYIYSREEVCTLYFGQFLIQVDHGPVRE